MIHLRGFCGTFGMPVLLWGPRLDDTPECVRRKMRGLSLVRTSSDVFGRRTTTTTYLPLPLPCLLSSWIN